MGHAAKRPHQRTSIFRRCILKVSPYGPGLSAPAIMACTRGGSGNCLMQRRLRPTGWRPTIQSMMKPPRKRFQVLLRHRESVLNSSSSPLPLQRRHIGDPVQPRNMSQRHGFMSGRPWALGNGLQASIECIQRCLRSGVTPKCREAVREHRVACTGEVACCGRNQMACRGARQRPRRGTVIGPT